MSDHGIEIEYNNLAQTYRCGNPESFSKQWTKFGRVGGLYALDARRSIVASGTVAKNALKYMKREVQQAKLARKISRILGYPSDADLAKIAGGGGAVTDVPIYAQDISRAEDINGPDKAVLQGKMRQSKSTHVTFEESYRPNDKLQSYLCDVFFIHGDAYLIGLMTPVDFTLVTHLTNRKTSEIRAAIRNQFAEMISQEYEVEQLL